MNQRKLLDNLLVAKIRLGILIAWFFLSSLLLLLGKCSNHQLNEELNQVRKELYKCQQSK